MTATLRKMPGHIMTKLTMPPSVSGGNYRLPLDHPQIEGVAQKLEAAYRSGNMPHQDMCDAIKLYRCLARVDRYFFNTLGGRELPVTALRPYRPDDAQRASSPHLGMRDMEVRAGFVWRVLEIAESIGPVDDLSEYCVRGDDI
jgi:hypothetical protein